MDGREESMYFYVELAMDIAFVRNLPELKLYLSVIFTLHSTGSPQHSVSIRSPYRRIVYGELADKVKKATGLFYK